MAEQLKDYYVTCPECGSPNVTRDCIGRWDFEQQAWVVSGELDNMDCDDCGHEGHSFEQTAESDLSDAQRATIFDGADYPTLGDQAENQA